MDYTLIAIVLGVFAAILSWSGVGWICRYAMQSFIDPFRPAGKYATPNGGGLVILTVVVLIFMPVGFAMSDPTPIVRFAMAGSLMAMIGFFDDLRTLPRPLRLLAQTLAAMIFIPTAPITMIGLPRLDLALPGILSYAVSILWVVGLSNVYNYMDNIDGLAGSHTVLIMLLWAIIALQQGNQVVMVLSLLIAGATFGFLFFNVSPANIYLGEVGGTFLGFSVAAMPMLMQGSGSRLIVTGSLFVGLLVFDAALTFVRYVVNGSFPDRPRRSHLYERLVSLGDSEMKVLRLYLLISACFGVAGIVDWREPAWIALLMVGLGCITLLAWVTRREQVTTAKNTVETSEI